MCIKRPTVYKVFQNETPSKRTRFVDLESAKHRVRYRTPPTCFENWTKMSLLDKGSQRVGHNGLWVINCCHLILHALETYKRHISLRRSWPSMRFWMVEGNWQFSPSPHSEESLLKLTAELSVLDHVSTFGVCSYLRLVFWVCGKRWP